tara:strand:- start:147 stop:473 length:327 start_codon:yes stop_codon:yes gene_type:complete
MKETFWKFTGFKMDFEWRERWEEHRLELREELMLLSHNVDPLTGIIFGEKSVHFASRNAWYHWKRYPKWVATGVYYSWSMQLFPTGENPYRPYAQQHLSFEVMKPWEE